MGFANIIANIGLKFAVEALGEGVTCVADNIDPSRNVQAHISHDTLLMSWFSSTENIGWVEPIEVTLENNAVRGITRNEIETALESKTSVTGLQIVLDKNGLTYLVTGFVGPTAAGRITLQCVRNRISQHAMQRPGESGRYGFR